MSGLLWISGLPGSGKTTLGRALAAGFRKAGKSVVILDGDDVRSAFSQDLGYSVADRRAQVGRMAAIARVLKDQVDMVLVCCASFLLSEFSRASGDYEFSRVIRIDASSALLLSRNQRNLYSDPALGPESQLPGKTQEWMKPESPDFVLQAAPDLDADREASHIIRAIGNL